MKRDRRKPKIISIKKKMPTKEVWLEKKNSRDQLRICTWVGRNLADSKILG